MAKKVKKQKVLKPKPIKVMPDELDRLRLAQETLGKLIEVKKAADLAEIDLETAKDITKAKKGAADAARLKVNEIIEAWERPLPLFDKPKDDKPAQLTKDTPPAASAAKEPAERVVCLLNDIDEAMC